MSGDIRKYSTYLVNNAGRTKNKLITVEKKDGSNIR